MDPSIYAALGELAACRAGVITLDQLYEAGLTLADVRHARRRRLLERLARGVYRFTGAPRTFEQRVVAALAASGPAAVASHNTAAWLLGIQAPPDDRVHVTLPRGKSTLNPLALVHLSIVLRPADMTEVRGLRCTSAARTLLDLAGVLSERDLERAVDDAFVRQLADPRDVIGRLTAFPGHGRGRAGSGVVRATFAPWALDGRPESQAEARLIRRLLAAGVEEPVLQYVVRDEGGQHVARLDAAWPGRRVALEYESDAFHASPRAARRDRARYADLTSRGWKVVPATADDIADPTDLIVRLARLGLVPAAAA